ncbi:MAG TPA: hypothetical protein VFO34_12405 [Candidatus Acidoferrales bacterium]|nr:hypothetical protein [Candidatus Acidoferrales bacterium]
MIDSVDSNSDPAGKQYCATVAKNVKAANGVLLPQGSPATIALSHSGSSWLAQLTSITVNGQPFAVTSTAATLGGSGAAAQNAANAVGSVLGGFGHHSNTAAQVTAAASGARVFLPPGTNLNFTLGAPPAAASAPAATAAPAAGSAPSSADAPSSAGAPTSASAPTAASAPSAGSAPNSASATSAAPTSAGAPSSDTSQAQPGSYFYCFTDYSGDKSYLSDIFFYPLIRLDPHSNAAPEMASNYQDYLGLLNVAFKKYLEKNNSFKSNSNYPVTCGSDEQLPVAKMNKARMAGMATNDKKTPVDTGWTNKDVVPSAYCTSGAPDTGLNYSEAFVTNGRMRAPIISAFMKFTNTKAAACYLFPDIASAKAERDRQFTIAKGYGKLSDTGWKGQ